ncbi:hypothetical protein [Candidatus Poriferisocius sp.]|uniref:hypothetical protein n=1 Tax=Candidatus Poriferisocius sp. TaxID=3101276 RepID=UPI003B013306
MSLVAEGDLRIIAPRSCCHADRRIGLVLRVDAATRFAEVLLAHTAPEMATDRDAVLPLWAASAPYVAVVQTDLRGAVWLSQFGWRVGQLPEPALADVKAGWNAPDPPIPRTPAISTGLPLAGPLDLRWRFKEPEGTALRALTAQCTEALIEEGLMAPLAGAEPCSADHGLPNEVRYPRTLPL